MSGIANPSTPIAARPRRRFPAGHGGAFPLASQTGAIRASANPLPPPARPIARLRKAALLCLITSAALQQAAATLMAMPKSS